MIQRATDLTLALILCVVAAPLTALTAVIVAGVFGHPVFFIQVRSGRNGRPFTLFKLRTMFPSSVYAGGQASDAARTPPVGRLLRRLRLDELPQLVNILRGDMAFIGPRPLLPQTIAALGDDGRCRGAVRPGLTGWAQVHGNTRLSDREKLLLDLWYVDHRNPARDVALLVKTVGMLVFGERHDTLAMERARASYRRRGS